MQDKFDLIVVGTGFASTFFLKSYLEKVSDNQRILVLERGLRHTHQWQLENGKPSAINWEETIVNNNPDKHWKFNIGFGGGSNCWWAGTPRFMPNDFRLQSAYGVGVDWPLNYDELEPYYYEVEKIMAVSGPDDGAPYPRKDPYPEPPHRFTEPDKVLKSAYPGHFFQQPSARARNATKNRPRCCASGICNRCPIDAKFTIQNELAGVYEDPRVQLLLGADVNTVSSKGDVITAVNYIIDGVEKSAKADLIVLGAHAIFNPFILQKSGLDHPALGAYLHEQVGLDVEVDLDGLDNYQGSTSVTGHLYSLYDGAHRSEYAACLIETSNVPKLRAERGKWRQRLNLRCIFEDIPSTNNYVKSAEDGSGRPEAVYKGHSAYTQRAIDRFTEELPQLLSPLPVETYRIQTLFTEAHIQGTTRMHNDPKQGVVDRNLVHHKYRNMLLLGSGAFPSCSPANPTLTLSALSLWAADKLLS